MRNGDYYAACQSIEWGYPHPQLRAGVLPAHTQDPILHSVDHAVHEGWLIVEAVAHGPANLAVSEIETHQPPAVDR